MFLPFLPGYKLKKDGNFSALMTLAEFDKRFRLWLVNEYLHRKHSEIDDSPMHRWESFPFIPRMPESLEQLDLLLHTVAKARKVQRDGIRFQGFRYFDVNLSGYVGEYVTIRYDPRDLAVINVYADDILVCKAICFELSNEVVSVKDVIKARRHRKKELNQNLRDLMATAEKHVPTKPQTTDPAPEYPKFKIKRFACDDD